MRAVAKRGVSAEDTSWIEQLTNQRLVIGAELWCRNGGCPVTYAVFFDAAEQGEAALTRQADHLRIVENLIYSEHAQRHPTDIFFNGEGTTALND
jgi:hypothetical protein